MSYIWSMFMHGWVALFCFGSAGHFAQASGRSILVVQRPACLWQLMLTIHGWTVPLALSHFAHVARDLQAAEVFSGVGEVWGNAAKRRLPAAGFDKDRLPGVSDDPASRFCEDLCTATGLTNAMKLVARLVEGGLLWLAPLCASFIWLNLANTKRCAENWYFLPCQDLLFY